MRESRYAALLFFLTSLPATGYADIIAEVTAGNGDLSVIFDRDTDGPNATSGAASLFEVNPAGSTTMTGTSTAGQLATVSGGQSMAFRMTGALQIAELSTRQRLLESKVVWRDTLVAPAGASGAVNLIFKIDGVVNVEGSVTGTSPERWDFLAVEGAETVRLTAAHNSMTSGESFSSSGFSSLSTGPDGSFGGLFQVSVDYDTPFELFLTSSLFAEDIETLVEADLGQTILLESVQTNSGDALQSASFASGISFDAGAAAVPEPSAFAALGVLGLIAWRSRRRQAIHKTSA